MKHYCNPKSRAATTIWMLKELDAPHEQIVLDFAIRCDWMKPSPKVIGGRDGTKNQVFPRGSRASGSGG